MLDIIELSEEERKVGEKAWRLNLLERIMFYILLASSFTLILTVIDEKFFTSSGLIIFAFFLLWGYIVKKSDEIYHKWSSIIEGKEVDINMIDFKKSKLSLLIEENLMNKKIDLFINNNSITRNNYIFVEIDNNMQKPTLATIFYKDKKEKYLLSDVNVAEVLVLNQEDFDYISNKVPFELNDYLI